MKQINFRPNETDQMRLSALVKELGIKLSAVLREAIRLLYKKEITK